MTPRQRFRETMRYGRPDRVPYFEEGLRDNVLERWREQGLSAEGDLAAMFDFDRRESVPVELGIRPPLKRWPTSRRGLAALRRRLDADDADRLPADWPARLKAWATREELLELPIHPGLFLSLGVEEWPRLQQVLYQLGEQPALVREMMEIIGRFRARMAERVLRDVQVDFASFSEPIAGNNGPLLSPRMYEEVVLPGYRPILEALRRHGVETIVFVSYANPRPLLPAVVQAGFNCLWACEANPQTMDYRDIRRQFGRDLRLIGGIDLDVLLADAAAIRREIRAKVPPLLAEGGYVPLADGRVRVNIPFANYVHYRRLLEEATRPGASVGRR
jgi:hypothetical protein